MRPRFLHAGYLTPPGNGEYWAECWYPLFVAYVCCNGFALVFSVAAIVAVLVGPIILVCLDRPNWRVQIAVLAIIHLAFSLASFLAAFALAGFITASVNAPSLNCGNLKCEEGGVPCSAYTLRSSDQIYAHYNETSKRVEGLGTYNGAGYTLSNSTSLFYSTAVFELVLDPVVAQLNNNTFGDAHTWETLGKDVVCRDYNYLALNSFPDGHPLFNGLNDSNGKAIDKACLVLLEHTLVSAWNLSYFAKGSARSGWNVMKSNAHTLWCSTNKTNLGPGWLPLTLQTGLALLHHCTPEAYDDAQYYNVTGLHSQLLYAIDEGGGRQGCPNLQFSKSASTSLAGVWQGGFNVSALQLLSDKDNAWNGNGDAKYQFGPGDHAFCNMEMQPKGRFDRVFAYASRLGWDRSGVLFRPSRNGEYVDPALCQDVPHDSSVLNHHPLRSAKLYASLRFQCSGLEKGVLCDFGVDPPLAVSPDGRYLSKRNMPDLPDVVVFGSPQTATSVELAVIGMVIAVLVSNLISITFLACWPRLMRCATKLRERFAIARDASFGAPQGAVSSG